MQKKQDKTLEPLLSLKRARIFIKEPCEIGNKGIEDLT